MVDIGRDGPFFWSFRHTARDVVKLFSTQNLCTMISTGIHLLPLLLSAHLFHSNIGLVDCTPWLTGSAVVLYLTVVPWDVIVEMGQKPQILV